MAFVRVNKGQQGGYLRSEKNPSIKMSARLQDRKTESKTVAIYPNLLAIEAAGLEMTKDPDTGYSNLYLDVLEGIGDDIGFWMLVPSPKGYTVSLSKEQSLTCTMSVGVNKLKHYILNECPADLVSVEFTCDAKDHSILIQVPDWLRFNPLSVPQTVDIPLEEDRTAIKVDVESRLGPLSRVQRRKLGKVLARNLQPRK